MAAYAPSVATPEAARAATQRTGVAAIAGAALVTGALVASGEPLAASTSLWTLAQCIGVAAFGAWLWQTGGLAPAAALAVYSGALLLDRAVWGGGMGLAVIAVFVSAYGVQGALALRRHAEDEREEDELLGPLGEATGCPGPE